MATFKKSVGLIVPCALIAVCFYIFSKKTAKYQGATRGSADVQSSIKNANSPLLIRSQDGGHTFPPPGLSVSERMAQARSLTDVYKRSLACMKIIEELCAAGELDTAWKLIDSTPGFVRNSELARFFKCAGLNPAQFVERIQTLDPGDTIMAFSAYAGELSPDGVSKALQEPSFKLFFDGYTLKYPNSLSSILSDTLLTKLHDAEDLSARAQAMEFAEGFHIKGMINDNHFAAIINEDRGKSAFEKWEVVVNKIKSYDRGGEAVSVRKSLVEGMVYLDANRAMEEIIKDPGNRSIVDIVTAIKHWGTVDAAAANRWYVENSGRLNSAQRDGAAVAFSKMALGYNELDGAEKWAAQISEPTVQKRMLDEIKKQVKK